MFDESISPIFLRDLNQNLDAITNNSERMKKGFSVIVNDKDEINIPVEEVALDGGRKLARAKCTAGAPCPIVCPSLSL